ncbi:MAG: hypothetical protein KTR15_09070, partial [Phycisphaeraceae bacterium]|nr:hypothetical protein [Phycisphaeraceae bacterium]
VNKGRFEILSLADDAQERFEQLIDLVRGRGQQAFSVNPIKPDNGDPAATNASFNRGEAFDESLLSDEQALEPDMPVLGLAAS